jgi:long-chain acyl-CoA synthetase
MTRTEPRAARPGLSYPQVRLDGLLAAAATAHGDRTAVVTASGPVSYAGLDAAASRWSAALRGLLPTLKLPGVGVTVAAEAVLDPAFAAVYYGTLRSGNMIAPVDPLLPAAPALAQRLAAAGVRIAVVRTALARRLAGVLDRAPDLRAVVLLDRPAGGAGGLPTRVPCLVLADLLAAVQCAVEAATVNPEHMASVQFTGGTGRPRLVHLSHRSLVANAFQVADAHRLDGRAVVCNDLPAYHPVQLNSAVAAGAVQVLCTAPDPVDAAALAAGTGASHWYSTPARLLRLAADPRPAAPRLPALRVIVATGTALPAAALPAAGARALAAHFGAPVIQGYGPAASVLTHCDLADAPRPGSVGPPLADTECRVVDASTGAVLGAGRTGRVQVRGPQLRVGYLDEAPPAVLQEGWLPTGSTGRIDVDGWLYLEDRAPDAAGTGWPPGGPMRRAELVEVSEHAAA